jgi:predicted ATPase/DNA-binding SARP family transcriptional activator
MLQEAFDSAILPTTQPPAVRIYLLGPLRVERDGVRIHLPRRKVESLLAYLLLHPESHSRDQLATLFWGDSSDTQARHSLRTALATIRKEVSPDLLLADRDHIQRNPDFPLWVDLLALLGLEEELASANSELLKSKVALWQGELLAGYYDEWLTLEREHYHTRLLALGLQVTQTLRARSEYEAAIAVAQQLLRFDPANEAAHQHLMFCYVAAGDRSAALRQYELCERTLRDELAAPPQPETTALYHWIRQQEGASTAARITNLPLPLTSFVGRQQESAEVKRLLIPTAGKTRLLTLTGAGGSGKTRLSIQVATDLIDSFAHGVWWVELAALSEGDQVARAVAKALGVSETPTESILQSIISLIGDKHLLLVLDNCEHLIEAAAQVAAELLSHCPQLQILATSREALDVPGELIWPVPTLGLPDPQQIALTDLLLQHACIRLFFERASAVQPSFQLTLENAPAVVEICTRLDGIPLAIELAAARVKVLPVEQIAAYLKSTIGARFALLTQSSRTVQPRQQTLRAAIDWSYDLLDEDERHLFRTVAVFRGGFTLEALEQVVDAPRSRQHPLDLLTQLVDKSLVIVEPQGDQNRYRMLETLREYALEQFSSPDELQALQQRHAAYFLHLAEQAEPELVRAQQQRWLERLETEHPNLRTALDYLVTNALGDQALRLAGALCHFWEVRGYVSEGRTWLAKALSERTTATPEIVAKALHGAGSLAYRQGDFDEARRLAEEGLFLFEQAEDEYGIADLLILLAVLDMEGGNYGSARQRLENSLSLAQSLNYQQGIARALNRLGGLAWDQDRFTEAREYYGEHLRLQRSLGHQVYIANGCLNVGDAERMLGNLDTARAYYEEALQIARTVGHKGLTGAVLKSMGMLAFRQQNYDQARQYGEEALAIFQQVGDRPHIGFALCNLGDVARKTGNPRQALAYYQQYLQIMYEVGYKWPTFYALEDIAEFLSEVGQHAEAAARFWGAAATLRQETGIAVAPNQQPMHERVLAKLEQQLGALAFHALLDEGRNSSLAQIVAEATTISLA